jgi:hypothetical protein
VRCHISSILNRGLQKYAERPDRLFIGSGKYGERREDDLVLKKETKVESVKDKILKVTIKGGRSRVRGRKSVSPPRKRNLKVDELQIGRAIEIAAKTRETCF